MAYPDNLTDSPEDRAIADFFTFRPGQPDYVNGPFPNRNDQWSWLEIYPQHGYVKRARRRIRAGLGRFGPKHFVRIQRTLQRIQHERDVWAELQYAERVRPARGRIPVRMEFSGAVEPRLRTRSGTGVRHRMERIHRRTMAARTRMGRLPVLVRRSVRFESQPRYRTEQKLGRQRRCLLPTVGRQRPKIQGDDSARKGFGAPNDQDRQSRRMGRRGSLLRIVQRQHDAPGSLRLLRPLLHEQHRP